MPHSIAQSLRFLSLRSEPLALPILELSNLHVRHEVAPSVAWLFDGSGAMMAMDAYASRPAALELEQAKAGISLPARVKKHLQ